MDPQLFMDGYEEMENEEFFEIEFLMPSSESPLNMEDQPKNRQFQFNNFEQQDIHPEERKVHSPPRRTSNIFEYIPHTNI
jgi:hypothetical protein